MTAAMSQPPVEADTFFDEAPAPLAVVAPDGSIVRANAAFVRAASGGASVVGLSFASLLREEDRPRAVAALGGFGATTFEAIPVACAASSAPRAIHFTVARSSAGLVNVVGVERSPASAPGEDRVAQLEAELRDQLAINARQDTMLQVFSQLLDTAPVIVWAADPDGTYTLFEGKGLELVGANPGEAVGQNAIEVQEDSPDVSRALVQALGGEATRFMSSPAPGVHFENWFMPLYRFDGTVGAMGLSIDATERVKGEQEAREKLDLITRQSATIRALATPIIQVWEDVLCLPVIGTVDSARTSEMMQALLEAIATHRVRYAIVDLTGVEIVDTSTADHLIKLFRAAKLIGVEGILCGLRPAVAQTVVALGLELGGIPTKRTLREALKWCIAARAGQTDAAPARTMKTGSGSRAR